MRYERTVQIPGRPPSSIIPVSFLLSSSVRFPSSASEQRRDTKGTIHIQSFNFSLPPCTARARARFNSLRASEKCQREKRKTINGDDLLWAMATLGFEEYIEPLKLYLQKYREVEITLWFRNWSALRLLNFLMFLIGDNKVPSKGADNPGRRESMGLQVINQPGASTQGEINLPQHSSFAHGMTYAHSQSFRRMRKLERDFSSGRRWSSPQVPYFKRFCLK